MSFEKSFKVLEPFKRDKKLPGRKQKLSPTALVIQQLASLVQSTF